MTVVPLAPPKRLVELEVDGTAVRVPEGSTILDAPRAEGETHKNTACQASLHNTGKHCIKGFHLPFSANASASANERYCLFHRSRRWLSDQARSHSLD
jgi:hypothetical protein